MCVKLNTEHKHSITLQRVHHSKFNGCLLYMRLIKEYYYSNNNTTNIMLIRL